MWRCGRGHRHRRAPPPLLRQLPKQITLEKCQMRAQTQVGYGLEGLCDGWVVCDCCSLGDGSVLPHPFSHTPILVLRVPVPLCDPRGRSLLLCLLRAAQWCLKAFIRCITCESQHLTSLPKRNGYAPAGVLNSRSTQRPTRVPSRCACSTLHRLDANYSAMMHLFVNSMISSHEFVCVELCRRDGLVLPRGCHGETDF